MHLLQLKIKNLASLRGEHVIDFETLSSEDMFAITGETGAGKSTLLNAISLALYGEIYKSNLYQPDLVTLGERDAAVELKFSLMGATYLATWSITVRKKNGELLKNITANRALYSLQDEPRILTVKAEELLSLSFDQFSKCVVLNQGEFARFLTAKFSERRDILERLYPSDNLEAVGSIAKKRFDQIQEKLSRLDVQVHSLSEETLFDVSAVRASQEKFQQQYEASQAQLKSLRPWAQGLTELKSYATKHREAREKLVHSEALLKARTQDNNLAMTRARDEQATLEQFEAQLKAELPQLEADDQEVRSIALESARLTEEQKLISQSEQQLQSHLDKSRRLTEEEKALRSEMAAIKSKRQYPEAQDLSAIRWSDWEKTEKTYPLIQEQTKHATERLAQLTQSGLELGQHEKELKTQHATLLTRLPEKWRDVSASVRQQNLNSMRDDWTRCNLEQAERAKLNEEIKSLSHERSKLKPELESLKLKVENENLKALLANLKAHLKSHSLPEACPLCERALAPSEWQRLTPGWTEVIQSSTQEEFASLERDDQRFQTRLEELEKRVKQLLGTSSISESALSELSDVHQKLTSVEVQLEEVAKRLSESRKEWKLIQDKQAQANTALTNLLDSRQQLIAHTSDVLKSELTWSADLYAVLLRERELAKEEFEKRRHLTQIQSQVGVLTTEAEKLKIELWQLKEKNSSAQLSLKLREDKIKERYPTTLPLELIKNKNEEIRQKQARAQLLQMEYRQKEVLLAEARSNLGRIHEQIQQLDLLFSELLSRLQTTRSISLTIQDAENVLMPLAQEVEAEILKEEEASSLASSEREKLKTLLAEDEKRREKKALFEKQQEAARSEALRWRRLLDVIGNDDMSTFVLSLVEAALIQQTNFELEKLCASRYEIQHNTRKGKLVPEFWVIDRFKDGMLRKVTTLSGGETFMVSLAMALALAEMTRGRADIDCFFIDEGFGTLDEDSLEDVMDMLQQVRSRGKQIGLITHVKSLSSRLPLNLKITKDSRGNSHTQIVWN